jgi:hypothetical protein
MPVLKSEHWAGRDSPESGAVGVDWILGLEAVPTPDLDGPRVDLRGRGWERNGNQVVCKLTEEKNYIIE